MATDGEGQRLRGGQGRLLGQTNVLKEVVTMCSSMVTFSRIRSKFLTDTYFDERPS